ncbi:ser/thr protein kinase-like protein [NY_014 poxvirus]|uniref:ser/thr protein kinase-like protein n=1 Tax=NY_014 poxvirus TaxID=2025360 RepID=UPI000B9A17A6|nr:ser/thr protein kinase-like protein [NY_014 poxvirus]AST09578.1 ser/thr protein kinase-like protein [NY_014 poxvirus]
MELLDRYVFDNDNNRWTVGEIIYSGNSILYKVKKRFSYFNEYVMKIDHKTYKPLLNEIKMYSLLSFTNTEHINKWITEHKLNYLAVPIAKSIGVTKDYRFIVTKNFGNVFTPTSIKSVYSTAIALINAIEYIHSHGFSHGKIEPNNVLINNNQITLIDYAKCKKLYIGNTNKHIPYNEDNIPYGNIKYMCLDYHRGANVSRRGDLEMLGYCIIEWFGGILPWENEKHVMNIEIKKSQYRNRVDNLIEDCFPKEFHLDLMRYLELVFDLEYDQTPDYDRLRKLFTTK